MHSASPPFTGGRIAFRCDGGANIGAGHVARCLPLAAAFAALGWKVSFVGHYDGLAAWLLTRAGVDVREPEADCPCGIAVAAWDAVVLDSYQVPPAAICDLARALPLVTLAEANRCPSAGILLDYHLYRTEPPGERLLAGPSYAPIDPAFAGAGRAGSEVRTVLVTFGGSLAGGNLLAEVAPIVEAAFPAAEVLVAGGQLAQSDKARASRIRSLTSLSALVDTVHEIDLTVTGAGFTSYEMACAAIPQVAIAFVENQRRVVRGLRASGLAPCLDLLGDDSLAELPAMLERLRDPGERSRLAKRGAIAFDGAGARRAAEALAARFLG